MTRPSSGPREYKVVTSATNPEVKDAKSLLVKKHRIRSGTFLIEGARFVGDAIRSGAQVETVFFTQSFVTSPRWEQLAGAIGPRRELNRFEWICVSEEIMANLSDTKTPQGVVAVARINRYDLADLSSLACPLFLVADRIQDPGNLGTMIRTAAAAGCDAVILTPGSVDSYSGKVLRATMGSVFRVPIIADVDVPRLIEFLTSIDCQIVVGDVGASTYHYAGDYTKATAMVVGNEGAGPDPRWVQAAGLLVEIPLARNVESLNAASAAAVLIYEAVRQRRMAFQE